MLAESVGSALLVGKLQGGRMKYLLNIELEKWWLLVGAAFVEFTASFIRAREIEPLWRWVDEQVLVLQLISYGLLLTGLLYNRKHKGIRWIILGVLLNLIVIIVNGGRMPVEVAGFDRDIYHVSLMLLESGKDLTHKAADDSTRLIFLADIIHFRKPYPLPKSLSIGDILMMVGLFHFIRYGMLKGSGR